MTRASVLSAAGLAVILAALASSAAAALPSRPQIQVTPIGRLPFPERGYVVDLPKPVSVQAKQVHVAENGLGVGNFTFRALNGSGVRYGTILVIDASNSMAGQPESAAVQAARSFVARHASNEQIGIVAFNTHTAVITAPTANPARLQQALANEPGLAYGTHIYDALKMAIGMLSQAKIAAGAIVLLSDGADVGSSVSEKAVVRLARDQHVRIFTVGLHSGAFDRRSMKRIAAQTSGAYAEATAQQLGPVYTALSARLASEYLLQYRSAVPPKSNVAVSIDVDGLGVGNAAYTAPKPSELAPYHRPFLRSLVLSWVSLLLLSLLVAGLCAFALRTFLESSKTHIVERVGAFSGEDLAKEQKRNAEEWRRRATRARSSGSAAARGWYGRLEEQLEIGRVKMRASRIILLTLVATVLAIVILATISPVFAIAGLATPLVTRGMIKRKVAAQRKAFAEQLPPNLQVLASALRAGHTLVGALSTTVEHADEPSKTELQRILADERLGIPLEDAIRGASRRMASRDLEQVALLAELQRTAGGNAAEVLDTIVLTVRERADVRRLVQTLTAQGRMARWILTALPVATGLGFWVLQPDLVGSFWRSHGGQIALLIAAILVATGSMFISRIVDIEV